VPRRVDFSANSPIYDKRHGVAISAQLAEALANGLTNASRIIDIGAGTGRVSVALANEGLRVVAVDPAIAMLRTMRQKPGGGAAEGTRLPFRRGSADVVILARLLYLVAGWQELLRETKEVLRKGGTLFHEWGNGNDTERWVEVREKARTLFQDAGIEDPFHPGARTELAVDSFLGELGFVRREQIAAGAGPVITLTDFLNKIASGEFSYIWNIPKDVQDSCLPRLRRWCESRFDLDQPVPIPAELKWIR